MQVAFKVSLLATLIAATTAVQAEEFRQHEAHVHGHVEFNIAQDGKELLVEITAPGADVVGFEHAPENEAQHEKIEAAEALLKQADKILLLSAAAKCQVEHVAVTNTLEGDEHGHEDHDHEGHDHDGHDHDKHDHDEHNHDKHDHDTHEHEGHEHEGHEHHEEGGHGEFTIEYHFECDNLAKLNTIDTQWFKHFPTTEEIEVNLLTDSAQVAAELNKNSTAIQF